MSKHLDQLSRNWNSWPRQLATQRARSSSGPSQTSSPHLASLSELIKRDPRVRRRLYAPRPRPRHDNFRNAITSTSMFNSFGRLAMKGRTFKWKVLRDSSLFFTDGDNKLIPVVVGDTRQGWENELMLVVSSYNHRRWKKY